MDFSVIQDQLFKAVETIFEGKIKEIPIDKCLECIVVSETQQENGSYKVTYRDVTMEAYPISNQAYNLNDIVYVMAIGGDLSKKKLILSAKNTNGQKFIDLSNVIPAVGRNFLEKSYIDRWFRLTGAESVDLEMSNDFIKEINGQTDIVISATIESNLSPIIGGTYGISLILEYEDGEIKEHALTLNEVVGNPYKAIGYQHIVEKLVDKKIKRIISLKAFISGFNPLLAEEYVKFSKIKVSFVEQTLASIAGQAPLSVKIISSKGLFFKNGKGNTTLKAQLYKGDSEVVVDGINKKYIWTRFNKDEAQMTFPGSGVNHIGNELLILASDIEDLNTYEVAVMEEGNSTPIAAAKEKLINLTDGPPGPLLDWVQEWDSHKVKINNTSILSPRIFAGVNEGTPSEPILTGLALGRDVMGSDNSDKGLVVYSENIPTIQIRTDGWAIFGTEEGRQFIIAPDGSITTPQINIDDISPTLSDDLGLQYLHQYLFNSTTYGLENEKPKLR